MSSDAPASPPGSPSTRERIIDTASALFHAQGYRATSLKQIADRIGISAPALYWHFSSKGDLVLAVVRRSLTRYISAVTRAAAGETEPRLRLVAVLHAYLRLQLRDTAEVAAYSHLYASGSLDTVLPEAARAELGELEARAFDLLRGVIEDGRRRGTFDVSDSTLAAYVIVGICEHVPVWASPQSLDEEQRVIAEITRLAVRAVGAEALGAPSGGRPPAR